ncbi:hypothetical protein Nmel_017035 [Mimus melanotis]
MDIRHWSSSLAQSGKIQEALH